MIDTYIPIRDFQDGETYDQIFMLVDVHPISGKKNYVRFIVQDVTGTMSGVVWNMKLRAAGSSMAAGKFIRMKVEARVYKGDLQLSASKKDVQPYDGEPKNITDYVPGHPDAVLDLYAEEIKVVMSEIEDPHVRDLLYNVDSRVDLIGMFRGAPYQLEGPLAHRGGLLMFTGDVVKIAKGIIERSGRIIESDDFNHCLVMAGCLLRHIGWATTTHFEGRLLRTENAFHMTGVDRASFRFINHLLIHAENDLGLEIPEEKKQVLENMCQEIDKVSTLEGRIVHAASNIAATLHVGQFVLGQKTDNPDWSANNTLFTGHLKNA
jgi:hypothetical protein